MIKNTSISQLIIRPASAHASGDLPYACQPTTGRLDAAGCECAKSFRVRDDSSFSGFARAKSSSEKLKQIVRGKKPKAPARRSAPRQAPAASTPSATAAR